MEKKEPTAKYFMLEDLEEDELDEILDDEDMQEFNTQNFYNRQHYCGNRLVPHDKKCDGQKT